MGRRPADRCGTLRLGWDQLRLLRHCKAGGGCQRARDAPDPGQADGCGDAARSGHHDRQSDHRLDRCRAVLGQRREFLSRPVGIGDRGGRLAGGEIVDTIAWMPPDEASLRAMHSITLDRILPGRAAGARCRFALFPRVGPTGQMIIACLMAGDRRRRLYPVDRSSCGAGLCLDHDLRLRRVAVAGRRQGPCFHGDLPAAVCRLHGPQRRLARQSLPGEFAGPIEARAPDRDYFAAAQGDSGKCGATGFGNR